MQAKHLVKIFARELNGIAFAVVLWVQNRSCGANLWFPTKMWPRKTFAFISSTVCSWIVSRAQDKTSGLCCGDFPHRKVKRLGAECWTFWVQAAFKIFNANKLAFNVNSNQRVMCSTLVPQSCIYHTSIWHVRTISLNNCRFFSKLAVSNLNNWQCSETRKTYL